MEVVFEITVELCFLKNLNLFLVLNLFFLIFFYCFDVMILKIYF